MEKFIVSVLRTSYAWRDIEISAASEAEARATVLDICGDYEFSEKDADYSIEQVADGGGLK
jgi:hypothetical protein